MHMHVRQRKNCCIIFVVKHIEKPNCIKQNSSVVAFRTLTHILYILRLEHQQRTRALEVIRTGKQSAKRCETLQECSWRKEWLSICL